MRGRAFIAAGAALLLLSLPSPHVEPSHHTLSDSSQVSGRTSSGFVQEELPLTFVENQGQWQTPAWYVARRGGIVTRLEQHALALQVEHRATDNMRQGVLVRMTFEGASPRVNLVGEQQLPGTHNFFYGQDPSRWQTGVPSYARVFYRGLYSGVDLCVREEDSHLEYDLLLHPGADLDEVIVRCEGIDALEVAPDGALVLNTAVGTLRQPAPKTWQVLPSGESRPVACSYKEIDDRRFRFEVAGWERRGRLVIDPSLIWSTFVGGGISDFPEDVAVSHTGSVTIVGLTDSLDFPTTAGAYQRRQEGLGDVFVTQLDPTGSNLVFSTYLGGTNGDIANAVALSASGEVILGGRTKSPDFPVTGSLAGMSAGVPAPNASPAGTVGPSPGAIGAHPGTKGPNRSIAPHAFDTSHNGFDEGFVARLGSTGSALIFSTYLGGATNNDEVEDVAVDASGQVTVVGRTCSSDFPITAGVLDSVFEINCEGFVARLNPFGTELVYSTYLGGSLDDFPTSVVVDNATGEAVVAGGTRSSDFPTTPDAFDTSFGASEKGFLCRLAVDGEALVYSTFFGSTGGVASTGIIDLAIDSLGCLTIGGETLFGFNFPITQGAYDGVFDGDDLFVSRLDPTGTQLLFSTFLGGTGSDSFLGLAVNAAGEVTVTGQAGSQDFPTTPNAFDMTHSLGCADAFVSHFDATGSTLLYSTFLGGGSVICETGTAVALDGQGFAIAIGLAITPNFPVTARAFDTTFNGGYDAWVARIDTAPALTVVGPGLAGANGVPRLGAGEALLGAGASLRLSQALGNASATLVMGFSQLSAPFKGGTLVPFPHAIFGGLLTDASGALVLPLGWPDNVPSGFTTYWQYWIGDPGAIHGLSASNALAITQP